MIVKDVFKRSDCVRPLLERPAADGSHSRLDPGARIHSYPPYIPAAGRRCGCMPVASLLRVPGFRGRRAGRGVFFEALASGMPELAAQLSILVSPEG